MKLRGKVIELLAAPDDARRLGSEARRTLERLFPIEEFREGWQQLASEL